ncbi:unnamed protein product [Boreogadus saida]
MPVLDRERETEQGGGDALPKLPVPALGDTLDLYLRTLRPLLTEEQYQETLKIVTTFGAPGGLGELLQRRLLERSKNRANWGEPSYKTD